MKTIKFLIAFILALALISALPLFSVYIARPDAKIEKNEAVAEKLKRLEGDRFAFIVMGDSRPGMILNNASTLKLIQSINQEGRFGDKISIDSVFLTGDNVFHGKLAHYKMYARLFSGLKFPVIAAIGNHDCDNDGLKYFKEYMGATRIAFASRNSFFITLDDNEGEFPDEQFEWFQEELKKGANYSHRFVFMHKPPFNPYHHSWFRIETTPWTRRFMKLCEDYKVDIVFLGHEHMFKELEFRGVRYVVTAGGGILTTIPAADGGYLHYCLVHVNGPYISYEVRRVKPPFWIYISYYLWKDLFYTLKGFFV